MGISPRHSASDILKLIDDCEDLNEDHQIEEKLTTIIAEENRAELGKIVRRVASEFKARASTLPFPDSSKRGFDEPHRALMVCLNYLDEIGREFEEPNSEHSTSQLSLQAFGTCVGAVAGLLDHLSQQNYNP